MSLREKNFATINNNQSSSSNRRGLKKSIKPRVLPAYTQQYGFYFKSACYATTLYLQISILKISGRNKKSGKTKRDVGVFDREKLKYQESIHQK